MSRRLQSTSYKWSGYDKALKLCIEQVCTILKHRAVILASLASLYLQLYRIAEEKQLVCSTPSLKYDYLMMISNTGWEPLHRSSGFAALSCRACAHSYTSVLNSKCSYSSRLDRELDLQGCGILPVNIFLPQLHSVLTTHLTSCLLSSPHHVSKRAQFHDWLASWVLGWQGWIKFLVTRCQMQSDNGGIPCCSTNELQAWQRGRAWKGQDRAVVCSQRIIILLKSMPAGELYSGSHGALVPLILPA